MKNIKPSSLGTVKSYLLGYVMSILLTILSFGAVQMHVNSSHGTISHSALAVAIFVFAMTQLAVQLVFFLHLGREEKPYTQSLVFIFTAFIITFLIGGSLWIMANLDYSHGGAHSMTHQKSDKQIINDEGIPR